MSGLAAAAMLRAHGALLQVRALTRVLHVPMPTDLCVFVVTHIETQCTLTSPRSPAARGSNCCTFLRPDGIAVPDFGYSSKDMIDEDLYPKGTWSEVLEIPPAEGLLSREENKVFEPPPPAYLH